MPETMTREEHLNWCKLRALGYVDNGDCSNAVASMMSDIGKHPETANHVGIQLGMSLGMGGHMNSTEETRKWIEGFN